MSFYSSSGQQQGADKQLGYDPCSLTYYDNDYILCGGSDRKVSMYTKSGVMLKTVAERDDWVWTVAARPKARQLVCVVALFKVPCISHLVSRSWERTTEI